MSTRLILYLEPPHLVIFLVPMADSSPQAERTVTRICSSASNFVLISFPKSPSEWKSEKRGGRSGGGGEGGEGKGRRRERGGGEGERKTEKVEGRRDKDGTKRKKMAERTGP